MQYISFHNLIFLFLFWSRIIDPETIDRLPRHFSSSIDFHILFRPFHAQRSTDPGGSEPQYC